MSVFAFLAARHGAVLPRLYWFIVFFLQFILQLAN